MIFSYNWLKKYVKKLPAPEELAKKLPLHSFEVEQIVKKGADFALDIDITANRVADCSSHLGIARECAVIFCLKLNKPDFSIKKEAKKSPLVEVEVRVGHLCPRYMAAVLKKVKVKDSPDWLKQRLELCGLQSINNVVDAANYIMLETGQPLHIFDLDKLKGQKIIVRNAKLNEKITTLDGQELELDEEMLVIADNKDAVAIAGIKGGKGPEVSQETENIVIEAANFNSVSIRKTSQKIRIRTDASYRFEHNLDPNLAEQGMLQLIHLIQEIASAGPALSFIDIYPQKKEPETIILELKRVKELLGIEPSEKEIAKILNGLGFQILKSVNHIIRVQIPTQRTDISIEEDIIEEIGRIYGYDKISGVLPEALILPAKKNIEIFWEEFSRDALKEAGMTEVYNYSFISDKQAEIFEIDKAGLLEIANPLSQEYKYLNPTLIPNLLKNAQLNLKYFSDVEIFELGKVFNQGAGDNKQETISEKRSLAGLIVGKEKDSESFYYLKGIIEGLFEKVGIHNAWYDEVGPTPENSSRLMWDLGRAAEIKVGDEEIGFLGYISQPILDILKIKADVVVFDLDFERFQELASERREYQIISPYPIATRDLAVLIPCEVKVVDALNIINRAGGKLVRDVDLFDFYEGENIPEGKKKDYLTIASYNCGPHNVQKMVLKRFGNPEKYSDERMFDLLTRYTPNETRDYLRKVTFKREKWMM